MGRQTGPAEKLNIQAVHGYFERYGWEGMPAIPVESIPPYGVGEATGGVCIAVVIPAYDERGTLEVVANLSGCHPPKCQVEIIVVINFPEGADQETQLRSEQSYLELRDWAEKSTHAGFRLSILRAYHLPVKKAGVGLARKIGMDAAVHAICLDQKYGPDKTLLVCLDADCRVAENYLDAIYHHFIESHPESPACSIYYEHECRDHEHQQHQEAIWAYELHLRIYTNLVRQTGLPYGFHTVGSSMAVRATHYMKQGGMNVRQAGEDFYFLTKLMKCPGYTRLQKTTVFPSSRISHRVPFGTGRAMSEMVLPCQEAGRIHPPFLTYSPKPFRIVTDWVADFIHLYESGNHSGMELHPEFANYLQKTGFFQTMDQIRNRSRSRDIFLKHLHHGFDAFRIMKWVNEASSTWCPRQPIHRTIHEGFQMQIGPGQGAVGDMEIRDLLRWVRDMDRALPEEDSPT